MKPANTSSSRREFLKQSGRMAAASALAGAVIPRVHAAENNLIQVALIGCGGRGAGAAANALSVKSAPIKLVALADVFENRLQGSYQQLKKEFGAKVDVPRDRRFLGFDAYQKAMDCLRPGDVAIFASPPAFRWVHFGYAIAKNLHVFMEKPLSVDGPTTRKMLKLAEESVQKNLKVGVGLMIRHCRARQELRRRIQQGQIGDIINFRVYRMHGPWVGYLEPKPKDMSELHYQVQRFHGFLWASGGIYSDWNIHQIDECCMMKGAWPIQAQSLGGRHYRGNCVDQNFDNYSTEFTFADGARLFLYGRSLDGCYHEFASFAHGSKGSAVITTALHTPGKCRIYRGQTMAKNDLAWAFPQPEPSPYQMEWDDLIEAIQQDKPYNEVKRGAEASLVTSMGRMAAHTGRIVTLEQIMRHDHEFAPDVDKLTMDGPAPLRAGPDGKYPVPQPGIVTAREY
jgi:predicted dehydrogenase